MRDKDGSAVGFICGDLGEPCADCGAVAQHLCDYPVGRGKTCDRNLCEFDGVEIAPDIHYCRPHFKMWEEFRDSGGVTRTLGNVTPYRRHVPTTKRGKDESL